MVSLPLIDHVTTAIGRLRGRRSLAVAGCVVCASCIGLVGWRVVERHRASLRADQPPLEDLIDRVGQGNDADTALDQPPSPATRAPRSRPWTSPLAHQCEGRIHRCFSILRSYAVVHPPGGERWRLIHQLRERLTRDTDDRPRMHHHGWSCRLNGVRQGLGHRRSRLHPRGEDQVSYHTLIGLDGQVVDLVDPLKRAYGLGIPPFWVNGR